MGVKPHDGVFAIIITKRSLNSTLQGETNVKTKAV